jgi:tetratricopeptide (TPR) repeat protein
MRDGAREQLLFGGVAVLVGALTWLRLSDGYTASGVPAAKRVEAAALERPAIAHAGAAADLPPGARDESIFAPPRELLPLDPLQLPEPPLPPLSVRRPAEQPALAGAAARAYRVAPDLLGSLVLADEEPAEEPGEAAEAGGGEAGESAGAAPTPAAPASGVKNGATATAPKGAATKPGAADAALDEVLEARHDWVSRTDGKGRLYGTLLNDDPVGLAQRPGEDLQLQQVSESTGRPIGAPFVIPRTEVLEFGLAATFDNAYRLKSRALGAGSGSASARRALAQEMLAAVASEPHALEYAAAEAAAALAAAPGEPASLHLMAHVQRQRHDLQGELALCRDALARKVADPALVAGHARLVRGLGLRERAWELLGIARTLGRQTAEVGVAHALLLSDDGRWEEAAAVLDEAQDLPFLGPLEELQKRELLLLSGEVQLALGRPDEALRAAQRVLLDEPRDVRALTLSGAAQAAQDALAAAAEAFDAALVVDPRDSRALTDAALVAWRQRDGDTARRRFLEAAAAEPWRAVAPLLGLGFLYEDAGDASKAADAYDAALELEPGQPEALYRLGRSQRQDGDPEAATETLRQALRLAGPDLLVLLELGRAAMDAGRHDESLRYFREAERLEPDNAEVQWSLGLAALASGDTLGCREPLTFAAAHGLPGAHVALAVASYRRGAAQDALDHFDEALKAFAGRADDSQARYAAEQSAAVRDNLAKRQWLDRFGRSSLQRGWVEHAWDGSPAIVNDAGRVVVTGRMEKPREDERPGIARAIDGRAFFGAAAELLLGPGGDTRAGLSLTYSQVKGAQGRLPKAQLDIWLDVDGQVRLSALDNFDTKVLDAVAVEGLRAEPGAPLVLGIERLDDVTGRFAFSVDGRRVGAPVEIKSLRSFKNPLDLQVWAEAAPGRSVDASVALVRIVQAP